MIKSKQTPEISWSEHLALRMEKQAQRCEVTYPSHPGNRGLLLPLSPILSFPWTFVGFSVSWKAFFPPDTDQLVGPPLLDLLLLALACGYLYADSTSCRLSPPGLDKNLQVVANSNQKKGREGWREESKGREQKTLTKKSRDKQCTNIWSIQHSDPHFSA